MVAWDSAAGAGDYRNVFARRFDSAGVSLDSELQVNIYTINTQAAPQVAMNRSRVSSWTGSAPVKTATSTACTPADTAAHGAPLGTEFRVNTTTVSAQALPSIAVNEAGYTVATW